MVLKKKQIEKKDLGLIRKCSCESDEFLVIESKPETIVCLNCGKILIK